MIKVTLPDGAIREYEDGTRPHDIAVSISASLAKKALAAKVNGEMYDLMRPLEGDSDLALITARDPEGLELIRHDAAHVLAQAVQALYPETQVTIGPVVADGFYYDFARETPFSSEDFARIEAKMTDRCRLSDHEGSLGKTAGDRDVQIHWRRLQSSDYR